MTNSDRWRVIAEAYDTPRENRSAWQRNITWLGLCWAWEQMTGSVECHDTLSVAIAEDTGRSVLTSRTDPDADAIRATLAGLLAAMTERERRALWREAGR